MFRPEQEPNQSIDEQMIPAKTKRREIQQYLPKKFHKWGLKNFLRAGESGINYNFLIYSGANTLGGARCSCEDIVLRLIEFLCIKISVSFLITGFGPYPSCKSSTRKAF